MEYRYVLCAVIAGTLVSVASGQGSYSTNIGAGVFVPTGTVQFTAANTSSQFPLLGVSSITSTSTRSPGSSGHEGFFSSVDRGLIEHTSSGSGTRALIINSTSYEGMSFGGSGSSSASWNDVVVSYVGGDVGSDVISCSAQFSVVAGCTSTGTNVTPVGYNVSAQASIAGTGGSASMHVQGSSGSASVDIPPVFVTVNQPFAVSMSLQTTRSPSGVAFGGQY